jgi:hypothetical protein
MKWPAVLLILICVSTPDLYGQDSLRLRDRVDPSFYITVASSAGRARFHYDIGNGSEAEQSIWLVHILPRNELDVANIVSPFHWTGHYDSGETGQSIRWATGDRNVTPGETLVGFAFDCSAIVGLLDSYLEGYAQVPVFEEGFATDNIPGYYDHTPYGPGKVVIIAGPVSPPMPFDPIVMIDSLEAALPIVRSLGWMNSDATRSRYADILERARTDLNAQNYTSASSRLDSLLISSKSDSGVTLDSQAFALIHFNTEYLKNHLPAAPPPMANILQNPGFESGTTSWSFYTNGSGEFEATGPAYAGSNSGHVAITTQGSNVQLFQSGLTLQPHTLYRLSFAAKCNTGHDVDISVQKHGSPYTNYGLSAHQFDLTTSWNTYSIEFTTDGFSSAVTDGRLMLWLAPYDAANDEYWFDEVSLGIVGDSVQIPSAPTLSSPANNATAVSQSPTLSWNASTGAASYTLQVSTSSGFGTMVVNQTGITAASYGISGLSASTTYYWRVRATNSAGTSSWSSTWSFTTSGGGGGGQNVLANGGFEDDISPWYFYTNGSGDVEAGSPAYQGTYAAHITIGGSGSNVQLHQTGITLDPNTLYRLSFAAKCNSGHDVNVSLFQTASPYTNYGLSSYEFNLTSSWNMYSVEFTSTGSSSQVTDGRLMFWLAPYASSGDNYWFDEIVLEKVGDTVEVPAVPTLASPANQDTGVSQNPTLSWTSSTGATSYGLQVSTSSGFGTTIVNQTGIQTTSYGASGLSPSTTYYWRVNATNSAGTSSWSTVRSFTTASGGGGGTNLLANGGFESGTDSWNFYTNGDGSLDAGTPAYQGSASGVVSITSTGNNMQLQQTGFTLQEGATYQLQFAVKANHARSIRVFIHKNTAAYDNYGLDEWVDVGTSWSLITLTFTASEFSGQTTNTRLRFWFVDEAEAGDTFSFDSITLVRQ